ncbi:MAG: ribonuclease HII [Bacillota bacterium]
MEWSDYTIKEIKEYISDYDVSKITVKLIKSLREDGRTGVKKIADRCQRMVNNEKARKKRWIDMSQYETKLHNNGYKYIAGIDEAGRGPLAGPVVASAVVLNPEKPIYDLDDSKKLTENKREELYDIIMENAVAVGLGIVNNRTIDKINILQATFTAMRSAVDDLGICPDYVLVDGNREIPEFDIRQRPVIDGDSLISSIAAASIIAKVTRDRIIDAYHDQYPEYGFNSNKGYGTSEHIQALKENGTTPIHRFSFSIVNKHHFTYCKKNIKNAVNEDELKEIGQLIGETGLFSEENLNILREMYQNKYQSIKSC